MIGRGSVWIKHWPTFSTITRVIACRHGQVRAQYWWTVKWSKPDKFCGVENKFGSSHKKCLSSTLFCLRTSHFNASMKMTLFWSSTRQLEWWCTQQQGTGPARYSMACCFITQSCSSCHVQALCIDSIKIPPDYLWWLELDWHKLP